ncbi:hypothetical protein TRFO_40859 [Tritrichomonas foetus]|uniref:Uncharacterized protein n=1 Tax=Tritrichomonas foetus TaxID=1144522 RepID=A0A1J4J063_9EUKA|nr:hypothetical protein TRFO_40859 [Tritrichomonas foetus]|eukprot:OHS92818.1 hypothetical protein TRFO_40859 [Tritrichomonas foetus]
MKLNDLNSINEEKFTYIDEKLTKSISFVKDSFDEMNIKLNKIELNQKNLNDIHINEKLQHELISFKNDMEQLKETFHQTFNSLSHEISTQDNKIERIKQNTELEHWKLTGNIKEQIEAYIKRSSDCVYKRLTDLIDSRITESKEQIQIHIDSLRREIVTDLRKAENNNLINSLNKEKISMEEVMKCTLIKQLKNNSIILHINYRHETLIDKVNEMEQNLHDKIQRQEDKCVDQLRINSQRLELNQSAFEKEIRNYIV